jgi:DNA-binding MarR family transcriptional regulator
MEFRMGSFDQESPSTRLAQLDTALRVFKLGVGREVPVQAMQTFIAVARAHPKPYSMDRLSDEIGYTSATASRNVSLFLKSTWKRKKGSNWIQMTISEKDRRHRELILTPDGLEARKALIDALST